MATNVIIVGGSSGGTNTNVVKVITQTTTTSAVTINAEANKGYILTGATLQTITLPFPASVGDVFALHGKGTGLFRVVHQTTSEQITLGDKQNTLGLSGTIESTNAGDGLYLICTDTSGPSGKWKNDGGYGGEFLIDGVTPTNTINNTIGGNDVTITSPSNNVRVGGTAPNLTADVGTSAVGLRTVVINNRVAGTHGDDAVAIGEGAGDDAGVTVQGTSAIAIGKDAAKTSQGNWAISIGHEAGMTSQGSEAIAIGDGAGLTTQGTQSVSIGSDAGSASQGNFSVAVGVDAGKTTQGGQAVAIGANAGEASQSSVAVAVGANAGQTSQGTDCVAVGFAAGQLNQSGFSVAIGSSAGKTEQGGTAVAVGRFAGEVSQGFTAVAIGARAGRTTQKNGAVAVGTDAGNNTQGANAVAVGNAAGEDNQGQQACAFGQDAGKTSQGVTASAFGTSAGQLNQGLDAAAFGAGAGGSGQGDHSTCLGTGAGALNALPYSVQIGFNCASAGANGRLAFGNTMEALTAVGATAASQSGWENHEWNGTHVRLPTFSAASESDITEEIGFVKMVSNAWTGRTFSFTTGYTELIPTSATYFSDSTANFTNLANGQLQYTGPTKRFTITGRFSGGMSDNFAGAIAINGTADLNSESYIESDFHVVVPFAKVLNTNDIVSVHAKRSAAASRDVLNFSLHING